MKDFKSFLVNESDANREGEELDDVEVTFEDLMDLIECVPEEDYVIIADAILDVLDEIDPIADDAYLALCGDDEDFEMEESDDYTDVIFDDDDDDEYVQVDEAGSGRFTNVKKGTRRFKKRKVQLKRDRISKKAELRKKRLKYRVTKRKKMSKKKVYRKTYRQKVASGKHVKKFHR